VIDRLDAPSSDHEFIDMTIPSSGDLIVLARFAVAAIGARAGFDLDEIDDIRLAVDELPISLGPLHKDTCLRFEFLRLDDTVIVRCSEAMSGVSNGDREKNDVVNWQQAKELSEQLLQELVDQHGRHVTKGRSVAWLKKRRSGGAF
jgi:hypothetical protein